jgi:aminopeptidase C
MNDHFHSANSKELEQFYDDFLRKCAYRIRTMSKGDLLKNKEALLESMLFDCYKILVLFLGEPPTKITWEYYETSDKNKSLKANKIADVSPLDFYKKYVPNYSNANATINFGSRPYNQAESQKPQQVQMQGNNHDVLISKLNYMIHLLEEKQDERTNNVTEEVVLYSFLGIFIIFVVDSFSRIGKYVR